MTLKPAFIFDLDGTLLDSIKDLALTANEGLAAIGLETLPEPVFYALVGNGIRELCRRSILLSRLQVSTSLYLNEKFELSETVLDEVRNPKKNKVETALLDEFTKRFLAAYRQNWIRNTVPFPGTVELLQQLLAAGAPTAVLSNKADPFVQEICERFFAGPLLTAYLGEHPEIASKPDPEGALLLALKMGREPEDTYFVGDSDVDMITAKRAGMKAVGVSWGFRSVEELERAGADLIVSSPAAIGDLISSSVRTKSADRPAAPSSNSHER